VLVTGWELAIIIQGDARFRHCFTQFPPSNHEANRPAPDFHRLLSELLECFEIPDVPDVATLNPKLYQTYKDRLLALEANCQVL
jgi:hypothetical protein